MKISDTLLTNPRIQELIVQEEHVIKNHEVEVEKLKDHLFFGMRFNTEQELQTTTNIFTTTMITLQSLSGIGSLYMLYKKKYLPTVILSTMTIALGEPTQYLLRKQNYITTELDKLEQETSTSLKKISTEIEAIIESENNKINYKGFFSKLFNNNKNSSY